MNAAKKLLTIDDLATRLRVTKSWIYQRTGPKARSEPRIPTIRGVGVLRFDPDVIDGLFFSYERSLKIKKLQNPTRSTPNERKLERVW